MQIVPVSRDPLLSNDVRYPARTHLFHVVSVPWIRAQEVLLYQTLDGYEPENAKTHKQRILWTVRTQQECESRQQSSGVHRVSHIGVSAPVDKFALCRHKTNIASQTQARPDENQQAYCGDGICSPVIYQGSALLQEAEDEDVPVGRDEGQ